MPRATPSRLVAALLFAGCTCAAAQPANPPPTYGSQYIGCFAEGTPRDLDGPSTTPRDPQACIDFCARQEYRYAGMQDGRCACGNSHGRYGSSRACVECAKWPGWQCGAKGANAVWELTGQVTTPAAPTLLPPRRPQPVPR